MWSFVFMPLKRKYLFVSASQSVSCTANVSPPLHGHNSYGYITNTSPPSCEQDWTAVHIINVSASCSHFYHLCMWVGNVFSHVCVSVCLPVCLCVCVSVFLSVQAITFEPLDIETSFLVCLYILTISRSSLSIKVKVIWEKMIVLLISTC